MRPDQSEQQEVDVYRYVLSLKITLIGLAQVLTVVQLLKLQVALGRKCFVTIVITWRDGTQDTKQFNETLDPIDAELVSNAVMSIEAVVVLAFSNPCF